MTSEKIIEQYLCRHIKKLGGLCLKFVSPNRIGVPDRLILLPLPKHLQKEVAKYMMFIECKSSIGKARPSQLREIRRIKKLGYNATIINSKEQIDEI